MNKEQFLQRLKAMLKSLSAEECADILYDYEEHFRAGLEAGKTEEEIARELGDPEELALTYTEHCTVVEMAANHKQKSFSRPLTITGLVLIDLCIALPVAAFLISLWVALFGLTLSLIAVSSGLLINFLPDWFPFMPDLARIFMGISFVGLLVLSALGLWACVKSSCRGFVQYFKWHQNIMRGGERV